MWFKDKKKAKNGNRRPARRRRVTDDRPSILKVKMKRSGGKSWNWRRITALTVVGTAVVAGLAVLWLSLQAVCGALFWDNGRFMVRDIRIDCPEIEVARDDIRTFLPVGIGSNIFAVNLFQARDAVMLELPRLQSLEISRRLPDLLIVRAHERLAVARLKMDGYALALDAEGHVLGVADPFRRLPIITGHSMMGVRPGIDMAGTPVMSALDVLNVCSGTPLGQYVRIARVDISDPGELDLLLEEGEQVRLAWRNMHLRSTSSRDNLELKLASLADIKRQGHSFNVLDMTLENNFPAR